jgi:hypothetical protein
MLGAQQAVFMDLWKEFTASGNEFGGMEVDMGLGLGLDFGSMGMGMCVEQQ